MRVRLWIVLVCFTLMPGVALTQPPPNKYTPPKVDRATQEKYREMAKKNDCPKGIPWLQGSWKFVGESRVPNFSDVITFKGNSYVEELSGGRGNRKEEGQLTGEIACLFKNRVLFQVHSARPEGLYGNRSGDDFPCDILTPVDTTNKDRFLMVCFVEWDLRTSKGLDFEYHRIQTTSKSRPAKKEKK